MKNKRHEKILQIIKENIIVTQDELQNLLVELGFNVTQSTVSRDIKELRIVKAQDINGVYRYMSPKTGQISIHDNTREHYIDVFIKGAVDVKYALNNIVIKCYNGMASSTCVAIDTLFGNEILGSLAGDDTIIIVAATEQDAKALAVKLLNLIK